MSRKYHFVREAAHSEAQREGVLTHRLSNSVRLFNLKAQVDQECRCWRKERACHETPIYLSSCTPTHLDFNVCCLAGRSTKWLMNHDTRIRERFPLTRATRSQQERAHRSCHAETNCGDIAWNELHGKRTDKSSGISVLASVT